MQKSSTAGGKLNNNTDTEGAEQSVRIRGVRIIKVMNMMSL